MSNSLTPKRLPQMNQETLERVLEKLRQPSSIAVLASLVAHGVLGAALPSLLANQPEELDTQRRVQVVELSPAEQSQLPTLDTTSLPPSLLPAQPLQSNKPAIKLPAPKLDDPSLYTFPLYPPPTFPLSAFPPSIFDIPAPAAKRPPSPLTSKQPVPTPPADSKPSPDSKPPADSKPRATENDPNQAAAPSTAPVRPEKLSPEQIAALQKDAQRSRQIPPSYTFNGPETAEKAAGVFSDNATAFIDVATKITGGNADDSRLKTPEKVTDLFPKDACSFVSGVRRASFGVILKPDGTLAEPPFVLLTSGYKGLDTAAIEDITSTTKNKKFSDGAKFQVIRFDYEFDPKAVCPKSANPA
ncbi:MAG: hypothetical protein RBJ76_15335 [Stenomitos frigidus ULC029]